MQHSKEKVPKKGVRISASLLILMAGAAVLSVATTTTTVYAQANAPPDQDDGSGFSEGHGTPRQDPGTQEDPNCWGDVTRQLAQQEDTQDGLGEHASRFGEPRDGVGNQAEDTPAQHGDVVGDMNQPAPINCIE